MKTIRTLQTELTQWHRREFGQVDAEKRLGAQVHKISEEAGELANAMIRYMFAEKPAGAKIKADMLDACADLTVVALIIVDMLGGDMETLLNDVAETVLKRHYEVGVKMKGDPTK